MKSQVNTLPFARDDFAVWQERWARDPGEVIRELDRRLSSLPADTQRAVFAHIPTQRQMHEQLEQIDDADALPGIPFVVKDLYDMIGLPTRAGSSFLDEVRGEPAETSKLVDSLQQNGMIFAGKTQLNEFAFGLSGENPHSGNCYHPRFPDALTGGSSSGSAWAVSSGLVPFALGTDTAGSIRVPAAFCGIYGLRLVPNAWSRVGCFPLAPSFDAPGWFTATAEDMRRVSLVLLSETKEKLGRGLFLECPHVEVEPELKRAYERLAHYLELEYDPELEAWGWGIVRACEADFDALRNYEAYEVHKSWLDLMKDRYSPEVWNRIDRGRVRDEPTMKRAWEKRETTRVMNQDIFSRYDFLVLPVTPMATPTQRDYDADLRRRLLELNIPASFCGQPVLTVPVPLPDGRSGGLQFVFNNAHNMPLAPLLDAIASYSA